MIKKRHKYIVAGIAFSMIVLCGSKTAKAKDDMSWLGNDALVYHDVSGDDNREMDFYKSSVASSDLVYNNLQVTPELLYGKYFLNHNKPEDADKNLASATEEFLDTVSSQPLSNFYSFDYQDERRTAIVYELPVAFDAGPNTLSRYASYKELSALRDDFNWCMLTYHIAFADSDREQDMPLMAAYEIQGDNITFRILDEYKYDAGSKKISLTFVPKTITYTYQLHSYSIDFTYQGKETVSLLSEDFAGTNHVLNLNTDKSLNLTDQEKCQGINDLSIRLSEGQLLEGDHGSCTVNGHLYSVAHIGDDGMVNLAEYDIDYQKNEYALLGKYEFVVFACGQDGLVLADSTKTYPYLTPYTGSLDGQGVSYELVEKKSVEEVQEMQDLSLDLIEELKRELAAEGIQVDIDEQGEMSLDADVLFDFDSSAIKPEGEALLSKFIKVFVKVLDQDKYAGLLSSIVLRGYTDSEGSKDYNLKLSSERAQSVLDYWSQFPDITASLKHSVGGKISTLGMGPSNLIRDEKGKEIPEKSRRVTISLYLNME